MGVPPRVSREAVAQESPTEMASGIQDAQRRLTQQILGASGVVGTALGECAGTPCIKVLVVEETEDLRARIPEAFDGFLVVIQETGEIRARPARE